MKSRTKWVGVGALALCGAACSMETTELGEVGQAQEGSSETADSNDADTTVADTDADTNTDTDTNTDADTNTDTDTNTNTDAEPPVESPEMTTSADPNDPYGACLYDDTLRLLQPFRCSLGGYCSGVSNVGCLQGDEVCSFARYSQQCRHDCEKDSDCPVPKTGDAEVACDAIGCVLPCDETTTCPDGFRCVDHPTEFGAWSSGYNRYCTQVFEFDEFEVGDREF